MMEPDNLNQWQCSKGGKPYIFTPSQNSIYEQIKIFAKKWPKKLAIIGVDDSFSLTYQGLVQAIEQNRKYLYHNFNLRKRDSISLLMENQPELLVINWTAWSFGLKTVPLDIKRDTLDKKLYKLKLTKTKLLFARTDQVDTSELRQIKKELPELIVVKIKSTEEYFQKIKKISKENFSISESRNGLESDCLILFTSGTTGFPKGARLTPLSLWADADQIIKWLNIINKDRFHILLPLHHINSTTFSLATILAGGTIVLSRQYSKSRFWKIMADHQATIASIVPTIAYDLLSEFDSFNHYFGRDKSIAIPKRIQIGSAPVQPTVVRQFYETYGIRLIQGYGSTETSLRCTGVPASLSKKDYLNTVAKNSIGIEMVNDNVKILNSKSLEVAENKEGEICIRGPIVMKGYLDNPQITQEAFRNGWFHSGDLGFWQNIKGKKYFFIKGRLKEIIIKGGINVSPLAVENIILKEFKNLKACFAVGFNHSRYGEDIGIVVDGSKPVLNQLQKAVEKQNISGLSSYEQPAVFLKIHRNNLPKTSTGKIKRVEIKRLYSEKLRLEYLTIANTRTHIFRLIEPDEEKLLEDAVKIHNDCRPNALASNISIFTQQARNGVVIGMFRINISNHNNKIKRKEKLVGIISSIKINYEQLKSREPWTQTWDGMTGRGTFSTHNQKGDCLVCCSITVKERVKTIDGKLINSPVSSLDAVTSFHQKEKGGYKEEARIIQVLEDGHPKDKKSLGYNVLLEYPKLITEPSINPHASLGTQLIEAVLLYAYKQTVSRVIAYSLNI